MVTAIAVIGILPYIALQLRGITMGLTQIAPDLGGQPDTSSVFDTAWVVTLCMAAFTVLFGTRHIDTTEHHRGMMMAVAFESLIKLGAFLIVGGFSVWLLLEQPDWSVKAQQHMVSSSLNIGSFLIHTLFTMAAIICLPRQFHTIVVENSRAQDLHKARWIFPGYLVLMGIFQERSD